MSDLPGDAAEGVGMGIGFVVGRSLKLLLILALCFGIYKITTHVIDKRRFEKQTIAAKSMTNEQLNWAVVAELQQLQGDKPSFKEAMAAIASSPFYIEKTRREQSTRATAAELPSIDEPAIDPIEPSSQPSQVQANPARADKNAAETQRMLDEEANKQRKQREADEAILRDVGGKADEEVRRLREKRAIEDAEQDRLVREVNWRHFRQQTPASASVTFPGSPLH